jgi:cob(I)alamin adenosyltransferase
MSCEEPYRVLYAERRTATIIELWLRPAAGALDYLPGEYVLLEDRDHAVPPRSYSIANAPRPDGLISLLVTSVPDGATSTWVHERLRVGEEVGISGPYGTFVDDPTSTAPCLFLAAGSGVAPVRALIEAALSADADRSLTLIFSARTEADVIDSEHFAGWQARHPQFRFIRTLTRDAGPPPPRPDSGAAANALPRPGRSRSVHRRRTRVCAGMCDRRRRPRGAARACAHRGVLRRTATVVGRGAARRGPRVRRMAAGGKPPIYTKTGDDGTTGLLFGGRVSKANPVVEVCGAVDEAVAALGMARASLEDQGLQAIVLDLQRGLFVAAAEAAANPRARDRLVPGTSRVTAGMTAALEQTIDRLLVEHPLRPAFVVPGATPASAALDLARTFPRRAERRLVAAREGGMTVSATLIAFVNRASDLVYVLARRAAGDGDEPLSHE